MKSVGSELSEARRILGARVVSRTRCVIVPLRTPTNSTLALMIGTMAADNRPALAKIDKPTLIVIRPGSPWQAANEDMQIQTSPSD